MLHVVNDHLVIESKGIYTVENYLMARRLMYWQVYLHKTAVAAEEILRLALLRAKKLIKNGTKLFVSPALSHFLTQDITKESFCNNPIHLEKYAQLDDSDILCSLKAWQYADDKILSLLSSNFINRRLFKVELYSGKIDEELLQRLRMETASYLGVPVSDADYFVRTIAVKKEMYTTSGNGINIIGPDGIVQDASTLSNILQTTQSDNVEEKFYLLKYRLE
jgi:HD superfamily phosphohydrolase